jgi:hypothetical protein
MSTRYFAEGTSYDVILNDPTVKVGDMIEFDFDNQEGYDQYNHKVISNAINGRKMIYDYEKNTNPQTHNIEPNESVEDLLIQDYVNVGDYISMNSYQGVPYTFEVVLDNTGEKSAKKVNMGGRRNRKRKSMKKYKRKSSKRKSKRKSSKRKGSKRKSRKYKM